MADLLLYAGIKANSDLTDKKLASSAGVTLDFSGDIGPANSGVSLSSSGGIDALWKTQLDAFIGSNTCSSCIVNTTYWRCGSNCNWCVPAGVTNVVMEMWGPGGSSSSNCCCGGAPFGQNGAYMALKFDVTPGECLCICSGCAYCCFATQTTPGLVGGNTWFKTDTNLGNTLGQIAGCAESAKSCFPFWNASVSAAGLNAASNPCWVPMGYDADNCSASQCSGWNFCWDTNDDDVDVPPVFSADTKPYLYCDTGSAARNLTQFKIPGVYPCMYINPNNLCGSKSSNAPVPRYESCICTVDWNGNTCAGCARGTTHGAGWLSGVPAAGGIASTVFAGCNACGGEAGNMGMVRINYTCN